jgi:hypothetical protein
MRILGIIAMALVITPIAIAGFGAAIYGFILAGVEINNAFDFVKTDSEGFIMAVVGFAFFLFVCLFIDEAV